MKQQLQKIRSDHSKQNNSVVNVKLKILIVISVIDTILHNCTARLGTQWAQRNNYACIGLLT